MTEEEWLHSNNPTDMLRYLVRVGDETVVTKRHPKATERKLRLWVAFLVRETMDFRESHPVGRGVRIDSSLEAWEESHWFDGEKDQGDGPNEGAYMAENWVSEDVRFYGEPGPEQKADALRHIFGNPFRE